MPQSEVLERVSAVIESNHPQLSSWWWVQSTLNARSGECGRAGEEYLGNLIGTVYLIVRSRSARLPVIWIWIWCRNLRLLARFQRSIGRCQFGTAIHMLISFYYSALNQVTTNLLYSTIQSINSIFILAAIRSFFSSPSCCYESCQWMSIPSFIRLVPLLLFILLLLLLFRERLVWHKSFFIPFISNVMDNGGDNRKRRFECWAGDSARARRGDSSYDAFGMPPIWFRVSVACLFLLPSDCLSDSFGGILPDSLRFFGGVSGVSRLLARQSVWKFICESSAIRFAGRGWRDGEGGNGFFFSFYSNFDFDRFTLCGSFWDASAPASQRFIRQWQRFIGDILFFQKTAAVVIELHRCSPNSNLFCKLPSWRLRNVINWLIQLSTAVVMPTPSLNRPIHKELMISNQVTSNLKPNRERPSERWVEWKIASIRPQRLMDSSFIIRRQPKMIMKLEMIQQASLPFRSIIINQTRGLKFQLEYASSYH